MRNFRAVGILLRYVILIGIKRRNYSKKAQGQKMKALKNIYIYALLASTLAFGQTKEQDNSPSDSALNARISKIFKNMTGSQDSTVTIKNFVKASLAFSQEKLYSEMESFDAQIFPRMLEYKGEEFFLEALIDTYGLSNEDAQKITKDKQLDQKDLHNIFSNLNLTTNAKEEILSELEKNSENFFFRILVNNISKDPEGFKISIEKFVPFLLDIYKAEIGNDPEITQEGYEAALARYKEVGAVQYLQEVMREEGGLSNKQIQDVTKDSAIDQNELLFFAQS